MISFRGLKSKFVNLKKEHECSISKLQEVSKEKEKALDELKKAKNDLFVLKNEHVCDSSFNEEMGFLKNRVDYLSTTLSDCASHTLKLESLCCKKNGLKMILQNHKHTNNTKEFTNARYAVAMAILPYFVMTA